MCRANIRAQTQAQDVTPKQDSTPKHATCVSTQDFKVARSGHPSSPPSPRYQDNFKFSRGAGAAPELPVPSRGSCSGSAQLRLCSAQALLSSGSAQHTASPG